MSSLGHNEVGIMGWAYCPDSSRPLAVFTVDEEESDEISDTYVLKQRILDLSYWFSRQVTERVVVTMLVASINALDSASEEMVCGASFMDNVHALMLGAAAKGGRNWNQQCPVENSYH